MYSAIVISDLTLVYPLHRKFPLIKGLRLCDRADDGSESWIAKGTT